MRWLNGWIQYEFLIVLVCDLWRKDEKWNEKCLQNFSKNLEKKYLRDLRVDGGSY
jgi:hypothetical protein